GRCRSSIASSACTRRHGRRRQQLGKRVRFGVGHRAIVAEIRPPHAPSADRDTTVDDARSVGRMKRSRGRKRAGVEMPKPTTSTGITSGAATEGPSEELRAQVARCFPELDGDARERDAIASVLDQALRRARTRWPDVELAPALYVEHVVARW